MKNLSIVLLVAVVGTGALAWIPTPGAAAAAAAAANAANSGGVLGTDPGSEHIAGLRIATWDDTLGESRLFEVHKKDGKWTIPDHFDYPADANTRVSTAAGGFLGVQKLRLAATEPKRFSELGVVDPLDTKAETHPDSRSDGKTGRGKRVTITSDSGQTLVDVVVGDRVEKSDDEYFVREIGSNEVWTAKVNPDLSTRFTDYVEVDPLKIPKDDIRELTVSDYSIDMSQHAIAERSSTSIKKEGDSWQAASPLPDGKKLAKDVVDKLVAAVTAIKLADVQPFIQGGRIDPNTMMDKGFYFVDPSSAPAGSPEVPLEKPAAVIGHEGRLEIATRYGLRYSLLFGNPAVVTDSDVKKDAASASAAAAAPAKDRNMIVWVSYDPSIDEVAKQEAVAEAQAMAAKTEPPKKDPKEISGKERAEKAARRFTQFYYVISDEDFKALRPAVDSLLTTPMAGKTGKTNTQWLADNAARPGVHTTPSGLQYEIISSGPAGGASPGPTSQVEVNYKGTLVDGEEFDSSKNGPITFGVNGVIGGWTEALQLMHPGDKWKLYIPPDLGYKEAGSPPKIGSNAILIFETELVKVLPPLGAPPAPAPTSANPVPPVPPTNPAQPVALPTADIAATPAAVAPATAPASTATTPAAVAPAATPATTTP